MGGGCTPLLADLIRCGRNVMASPFDYGEPEIITVLSLESKCLYYLFGVEIPCF